MIYVLILCFLVEKQFNILNVKPKPTHALGGKHGTHSISDVYDTYSVCVFVYINKYVNCDL